MTATFVLEAAEEALSNAKLSKEEVKKRCGAVIMSAASASSKQNVIYELLADHYSQNRLSNKEWKGFEEGFSDIDPAAAIAALLGTNCIVESVSNACASAAMAIARGADLIRQGAADVVLCGGGDTGCSFNELALFSVLNASAYAASPKDACRPFSKDRMGCVTGEGAGVLVLENLTAARRRGAMIYGEVLGYGAVTDTHHVTSPDMEAKSYGDCIANALENSNIGYKEVDYINAHGTGTYYNDFLETMAIRKVFKERAETVPVSSTKAATGHLLSAAGAIEAVISIMAMRNNLLPPTINLKIHDEKCNLDYISEGARRRKVQTVLSNSFGFGGQNVTLVFGKVDS